MVGPAGIEPATLCLEGRCSIQLSYGPLSHFNSASRVTKAFINQGRHGHRLRTSALDCYCVPPRLRGSVVRFLFQKFLFENNRAGGIVSQTQQKVGFTRRFSVNQIARSKSALRLAVMLCIFLLIHQGLAWGPGGHMMVAKIAYDRLNPQAKAQVDRLLKVSIPPEDVTAKSP